MICSVIAIKITAAGRCRYRDMIWIYIGYFFTFSAVASVYCQCGMDRIASTSLHAVCSAVRTIFGGDYVRRAVINTRDHVRGY